MDYNKNQELDNEKTSTWIDEGNEGDLDHSRYNSSGNYTASNTHDEYKERKPNKKTSTKSKKRSWKKGLVVLILAGLLISIFFTPLYVDLENLWGGPVFPEKATFSIERTFHINTNTELDYNMTLIVPEDIHDNDIQDIRDIEWGGNPSSMMKYGREWKVWDDSMLAGSSKTIQIVYEAETRTIDWGYSAENIGSIDDIPEELKERYNRNQWYLDQDRNNDGQKDFMIQPEHPQIRSLAEDIVGDEDNIYDASRAIYDWINTNINYEVGGPGLPKHAAWVLESRSGDCDEQSFLYLSLSRAVGIPAWMELGVLYDRMINQWGGHGWVRTLAVRDDGTTGWVNIDPVNDQFFARGATRFTSWVDDVDYDGVTWNDLPGSENENLFDYLESRSGIDWTESQVEKTNNGRTVLITRNGREARITLDSSYTDSPTSAELDIDGIDSIHLDVFEANGDLDLIFREHIEDFYMFFSYGASQSLDINEEFENIDMETEGQVFLGDGGQIPGFTIVMAIPATIISVMIYDSKKGLDLS